MQSSEEVNDGVLSVACSGPAIESRDLLKQLSVIVNGGVPSVVCSGLL